ncbi:hypothetical protein D3C72_2193530 [compost metagenome]
MHLPAGTAGAAAQLAGANGRHHPGSGNVHWIRWGHVNAGLSGHAKRGFPNKARV